MTLNEKSAGGYAGGSAAVTGLNSFSDVVGRACEKLMDKQVKYSIQRIQEMEECLAGLEKELDDFLLKKNGKTG